jgi:hypothetical protein
LQVVVGDKKTPDPWTTPDKWPIPPNVHYLSPARQLELGFKIIPLLPWANYGRKNIGFLYAIQQGGAFVRREAARLWHLRALLLMCVPCTHSDRDL